MAEDRPHRHWYVNGKLEFSFWPDPLAKTKEEILDKFMNDHSWKFMAWYCGWKIIKTEFSKELMRVDITVKEVPRKD